MTGCYDPANPRHIALRLSDGQASVIRGLDGEPAALGCGEDVAIRLIVGKTHRPPLVVQAQIAGEWTYRLNAMGCAVKAVLVELDAPEGARS
ncbi:hypothetical protein [uncultured Sphingomonas sp.]|uniref:hypothetical protein n=1 Tax=uncultured Sphingomonas sp. TaxID=158754 RepID=UPI00374927F1